MKKLTKLASILAIAALVITLSTAPSQAGAGWGKPAPTELIFSGPSSNNHLISTAATWQRLLFATILFLTA